MIINDLPNIQPIPFGGIAAAGGWCAPPEHVFSILEPMTDEEKIRFQRTAIENQGRVIKDLKRERKALRKQVRALESALAKEMTK